MSSSRKAFLDPLIGGPSLTVKTLPTSPARCQLSRGRGLVDHSTRLGTAAPTPRPVAVAQVDSFSTSVLRPHRMFHLLVLYRRFFSLDTSACSPCSTHIVETVYRSEQIACPHNKSSLRRCGFAIGQQPKLESSTFIRLGPALPAIKNAPTSMKRTEPGDLRKYQIAKRRRRQVGESRSRQEEANWPKLPTRRKSAVQLELDRATEGRDRKSARADHAASSSAREHNQGYENDNKNRAPVFRVHATVQLILSARRP